MTVIFIFFFQAEDGIRDLTVTGVQTCALPIFAAEGRKIGVDVTNNVDAKHWKRLRDAFLRCITERDFIGCLIVQEIMLESFAVASYSRVGKVAPASLGKTFARIAAEEEEHVDHAMSILRAERALDAQRFDDEVHRL